MPQYINDTDTRRYWPQVQNADGSTVELDPGESVELEEFPLEDGVESLPSGLSRVDVKPEPKPEPVFASAKKADSNDDK